MYSGWGVANYSREAVYFIPQKRVRIMGFLWTEKCRDWKNLQMKFQYRLGTEGELSEWYETREYTKEELIKVPQPAMQEYNFTEILFRDCGLKSIDVPEGTEFLIKTHLTCIPSSTWSYYYVTRSSRMNAEDECDG